jgi:ribose 1,5-bisphosphokinase PhnN
MVTYEATAIVEERLQAACLEYMLGKHIPEVLATGCFVGAVLERAEAGQFRVRYQAASEARVEAYLRDHTARLRQDFDTQFPTGIGFARQVWSEVARWRE